MKILFLNLASNHGSLAIVGSDKTIAFKAADHRISDADLLPQVEQLLSDAGLTFKDLTQIACVVGPGGFTSLRVAVAFANVLADQLNIPAAGVHLSSLYEARMPSPLTPLPQAGGGSSQVGSGQKWVWLHSTKSTHVFAKGFGVFAEKWPEPTLVPIEDLAGQLPDGISWAGELIPAHREALSGKKIMELPLKPLDEVLPSYLEGLTYEEKLLLPWYGRGW